MLAQKIIFVFILKLLKLSIVKFEVNYFIIKMFFEQIFQLFFIFVLKSLSNISPIRAYFNKMYLPKFLKFD